MPSRHRFAPPLYVCLGLLLIAGPRLSTAHAQELAVEGSVTRYFQSGDGIRLAEIKVRSVALEGPAAAGGARPPAPGDIIYVQIDRPDQADLPAAGSAARAKISSAGPGAWTTAGGGLESATRDDRGGSRRSGPSLGRAPASVDALGMTCRAKLVGGRLGLEVVRVSPGGVGQQAGFQPGDVIVGINGRPLTSAADVRNLDAGPGKVELNVIDVNTGRTATVELSRSAVAANTTGPGDDAKAPRSASPADRVRTALGLEVKDARAGLRRAVEVTSVTKGGPASQAGFEPGDVIVAVGKSRVGGVDDFADALPGRPQRLTLMVRDVRTGREVPVEVESAGVSARDEPRTPEPRTTTTPTSPATKPGKIGIAGQLTFYDAEAAVKVASVEPGSPADRAGVRAGMILLSADGAPLLHPNDLATAVGKARGVVSLRVVDPDARREQTIRVQL